jgi:hypothetical protein
MMDSEIEVLVFKPSSHFAPLLPSKCQVTVKGNPCPCPPKPSAFLSAFLVI